MKMALHCRELDRERNIAARASLNACCSLLRKAQRPGTKELKQAQVCSVHAAVNGCSCCGVLPAVLPAVLVPPDPRPYLEVSHNRGAPTELAVNPGGAKGAVNFQKPRGQRLLGILLSRQVVHKDDGQVLLDVSRDQMPCTRAVDAGQRLAPS
jgi:hypothetical protein